MYNEEETIGSVVTRTLRYVDEVICIDDGSSDSSARIAEACGATVIRYDVPKGSNFTAVSHGFTVMTWALLSLSQKKPLLVLGLPGFGLLATAAAMGTRTAQDLTLQLDSIIGSGFSAVWIGLLGLSLMATGLVLQSAQRFLRLLLVREFGLD